MTKRSVIIANGGEMVEKGVKVGRVGLLLGVSRTWIKAHARRQDPTYLGPFPCTQNLKNILAYARTELRMHECKLPMQAQAYAHKNINRRSSSKFSRKHHPKPILDMFLPLLRCQIFI